MITSFPSRFAKASLISPFRVSSGLSYRPLPCLRIHAHSSSASRTYASHKSNSKGTSQPFQAPSKALEPAKFRPETSPIAISDPINPPASTRPPPLNLPTRGNENVFYYYFRLGRAYGSFYKDGLKAVWRNHKAASALKKRIFDDLEATGAQQTKNWRRIRDVAVAGGLLTRAEFQVLERNSYDIGKLPLFGVLVIVFGEWLPLLVPFIPGAVPGTCRIPNQIKGMREKAMKRRRTSFRSGVVEPNGKMVVLERSEKMNKDIWPLSDFESAIKMLAKLRTDQLVHLCRTLNLYGGFWDKVQLTPPTPLLRRKAAFRVQYIALDDQLLGSHGGPGKLEPDEVLTACDERGIDVLGRKEEDTRKHLSNWLERQRADRGQGGAIMEMLFRRPNAWTPVRKDSKR